MKYFMILLCTISTFVSADTTLTFTNAKDKTAMQMQLSNNMMRATSVGDESTFMIYDANATTFTTFVAEKKQYYVMGKKELDALGDMSATMNKMIEEKLANVPAEQREMMAGALKANMPKPAPKAEYNFTGKSISHNGFDCKIVNKKAGDKNTEFCVTEYSKLGMSSDEYAIISSFQKTIAKLAQQYGVDNSMDFSSLGNYIPVKYMQSDETGTLKAVSHDKIDPNMFEIPKGYKKIDLPF
jgi:hypothetical protein